MSKTETKELAKAPDASPDTKVEVPPKESLAKDVTDTTTKTEVKEEAKKYPLPTSNTTSYGTGTWSGNKWKKADPPRMPDAAIVKRVAEAFDSDALKKVCQMPTDELGAEYANLWYLDTQTKRRKFWFKNNGSGVLGVAHLDSVQSDRTFGICNTAIGTLAFCPVLDDRLGAYIILEWLPKLGITLDFLLCDDEETGGSTADLFLYSTVKIDRKYNWMAEFDRTGEDPVGYQYGNAEMTALIKKYGWGDLGRGSFSDIARLGHLGCKGFNFGVSYEKYHQKEAYTNITKLITSIARFVELYTDMKDTHLPHEDYTYTKPATTTSYNTGTNNNSGTTINGNLWEDSDLYGYSGDYGGYDDSWWKKWDNDRNGVETVGPPDDTEPYTKNKKNAADDSFPGMYSPLIDDIPTFSDLTQPAETFQSIYENSSFVQDMGTLWDNYIDMLSDEFFGARTGMPEDALERDALHNAWSPKAYYEFAEGLGDAYMDWAEMVETKEMMNKCLLEILGREPEPEKLPSWADDPRQVDNDGEFQFD